MYSVIRKNWENSDAPSSRKMMLAVRRFRRRKIRNGMIGARERNGAGAAFGGDELRPTVAIFSVVVHARALAEKIPDIRAGRLRDLLLGNDVSVAGAFGGAIGGSGAAREGSCDEKAGKVAKSRVTHSTSGKQPLIAAS